MNKLLRFVFMAVLAMSFSSLFATNVTINTNSSSTTWTTETDKYSGVIGNFKVTCSIGTGSVLGNATPPAYIQIQKGNVLTIEETSGLAITKVVLHVKQGATIKVNGTSISKATDNTFTWGGKNTTKFEALNEGTPIKLTSIDITYGAADPNVVAAPTFDAVTPFVGKGLVTIKGAEGSVVYYTTDGSVPTTSSLNNGTSSVDVEVTETTTIKAIAVKNDKESVMVSKEFVCYQIKTIAQLNELTSDLKNVALKLTNAKVVYDYYKGYYVYVREGEYAVRFDGIFFGNTAISNLSNYVVNGTVLVDFAKNFGDCTLTANKETKVSDLTLTESSEVAQPVVTTIPELLEKKHVEDLIALKSVTITSRKENYSTVYDLTDESGNVVTAPSCMSDDLSAKADDGNKYDVKAIFESVNNEGKPQLTLLGFYEIANGITSVTRQESNIDATIYNMSGQRVGKSYKGLVVKAGRKYIAK
ncbi:chitobiase/beta-hexosaminidase C-terminal domain-containing protein [Prevotella sp.]|uniref:chitobiase/beta-hexosaminidase C-terminal domain-containing protein n=1 Tax=Prevotella sp. TaxID=59823 RepID=UPI002ABE7364|nr:chitobiase/beta-hexosaminidase C-terminal domain-containing protein [Prevotella sp.]